ERIEREMVAIDEKHESRARRIEILADLWKDVRLALRQLRRRPAFALAAILVIALGVGANGAVFAAVDAALFRPLPFPDGDRLVVLWDRQEEQEGLPASLPEFRDWERENDFLDGILAVNSNISGGAGDAGGDVVQMTQLGGAPRRPFGYEPMLGRWFAPGETGAVLLAEGFWHERFGARRDVVGKELELGDGKHTIVGVLPRTAG